MEKILKIKETSLTPVINWNHQNKTLEIKGKSIPGNKYDFNFLFRKLELLLQKKINFTVNIYLDYFDIPSTRALLKFFRRLEKNESLTSVNWFYEEGDEDLQQAGQDFKEMVKIPFTLLNFKKN